VDWPIEKIKAVLGKKLHPFKVPYEKRIVTAGYIEKFPGWEDVVEQYKWRVSDAKSGE